MKVVAISGVSGCGKTSVIKQLSSKFSCPSLLFDDYVDDNTYPSDMKCWFHEGADLSLIKTPRFIDSLQQLKTASHDEYIFIEEPFGRQRDAISSLIDYVILLDAPMEVCLSRVIMRHIQHPSNDSLKSIPKYLTMYNNYFREIYIELNNQTRNNSDLLIQQVTSVETLTIYISDWLLTHAN